MRAAGGVWEAVDQDDWFDLPVQLGEWIVCVVGTGLLKAKIMEELDWQLPRYGAVMGDPSNPVTRLRLITSDPTAVPFLDARARSVLGPNADLLVEYRP